MAVFGNNPCQHHEGCLPRSGMDARKWASSSRHKAPQHSTLPRSSWPWWLPREAHGPPGRNRPIERYSLLLNGGDIPDGQMPALGSGSTSHTETSNSPPNDAAVDPPRPPDHGNTTDEEVSAPVPGTSDAGVQDLWVEPDGSICYAPATEWPQLPGRTPPQITSSTLRGGRGTRSRGRSSRG